MEQNTDNNLKNGLIIETKKVEFFKISDGGFNVLFHNKENDDGNITYIHYKDDKIHNDNGPAIYNTIGDKLWFQNNKIHRTSGPAYITYEGKEYYFLDGIEVLKNEFDKKIKT